MQTIEHYAYPKCGTDNTWTMQNGCQTTSNLGECTKSTQTRVTTLDLKNERTEQCILDNTKILTGKKALPEKDCKSPGTPNLIMSTDNTLFGVCTINAKINPGSTRCVQPGTTPLTNIVLIDGKCTGKDPSKKDVEFRPTVKETTYTCPTGYTMMPSDKTKCTQN